MKAVKLSELIDALEFDSTEHGNWVDLQTGKVVLLDNWVVGAVEEEDEEALQSLPDWQNEQVEIARAMVKDSGERFIEAPSKFDFHEYRHMERFIRAVEDDDAAEQLWRAIKGKGAFRYFRDTASRLGLIEQWYQYREEAMKEFVMEWAEARKVPIVDDVTRDRRT